MGVEGANVKVNGVRYASNSSHSALSFVKYTDSAMSLHHSAGCGGGGGDGKRNAARGGDLKKLRAGGGGERKRNAAGGGDLKKLRSGGGGEGKRNVAGGGDLKKLREGDGGEVKRNATGGGGEVKRKTDRDLPKSFRSYHE
ncbi:circumsporozoite protein-like [Cucurbita pepo subsp. pepo]|uniref:circumsporozoite protein-like n=1 Tax=Cucurbita pepo subsp. pepo TaxID=3664 RepID=UPI000C9D3730|nr:circumsporozoite protein-like [Cucurbita pepo subsp. pepo]